MASPGLVETLEAAWSLYTSQPPPPTPPSGKSWSADDRRAFLDPATGPGNRERFILQHFAGGRVGIGAAELTKRFGCANPPTGVHDFPSLHAFCAKHDLRFPIVAIGEGEHLRYYLEGFTRFDFVD